MALARVKTWSSEILTSSDLNGEFNNILNNALSLISPLTGDLAFGGNKLTGLSLGSEGSPSLQFTGDTNTGIWSSGADTLDFSTAGVNSWRISSAGKLLCVDDNTYDIGASGATRPKDLYLGGAVKGGAWNGTAVGALYGGTGIDTSASTGVPQITSGTWSILATGVPASLVVKSADQTLDQSSTTLQNVTGMSFSLAASTNYIVELYVLQNAANTTSDFKFGWTFPVSCTMLWLNVGSLGQATALSVQTDTILSSSIAGTNGNLFYAIVRNSTNSGTLQLQAAQNTSDASDNKILKDSFLRVMKLQ